MGACTYPVQQFLNATNARKMRRVQQQQQQMIGSSGKLMMMTLASILLMVLQVLSVAHAAHPTERSITIMNESGRRVVIHWVHPDTGEMVLQSDPDVLNGASMDLNSYVGHTFQVRELPAKKTGVCGGEGEVCRVDHFTVNTNSDQGELLCSVIVILYVTSVANCKHCSSLPAD